MELIEKAKRLKVFKKNKRSLKIKILQLLYFSRLSLRNVSLFILFFEEISHQFAWKYYHRIKYLLKEPKKKEKVLIAVDEKIIKVGN